MRRFTAGWLMCLTLVLAAGLRLHHASAVGGLYLPHSEREEGYYEAGIAQLSCHVLGHVPSTTPSNFHAPLYPSFLALSESLFRRPTPWHPRLAQVALSTFGVAVAICLGWMLFSPLAGLFAGLLLAFHVDSILAVSSLNVHGFYGIAILAVGAAAVLWVERRSTGRAAVLGLMIAASLLCRPAHFPLPLIFAAACLFLWKFPEGGVRTLVPVAVATVLFLAPMSFRNGLQFGDYSPFDSKGAYVLLRATTGPDVRTTVEQALAAAQSLQPGFKARGLQGRALHLELIRLALREMARHPVRYAGYCLQRLFFFWKGLWLYLALAGYALWRWPRHKPLQALALIAASFSGYAVAGGAEEYRVSAIPVLCVISGCSLAGLWSSWRGLKEGGQPPRSVRSAIAALPALFGLFYCGMIILIALELKDNLRPVAAEAAMRLNPCPDGRALEILRLAAMHADPRSEAASVYADATSGNTGTSRALNPKANADRLLSRWIHSIERGDKAQALVELRQAISSDPERTCAQTPNHMDRSRLDLSYFDLCLGRLPNQPRLLADRGVARYLKGMIAPAAGDLARSFSLSPSLETALSLGTVLESQGRLREALTTIEDGLRVDAGKSSDALAAPVKNLRERLLIRTRRP